MVKQNVRYVKLAKFQGSGSVECEDVDISSNQYQDETGKTTPKDCTVCSAYEYIHTACTATSDTVCRSILCDENEYVNDSNQCVLSTGTYNAPGDDSSDTSTTCDAMFVVKITVYQIMSV